MLTLRKQDDDLTLVGAGETHSQRLMAAQQGELAEIRQALSGIDCATSQCHRTAGAAAGTGCPAVALVMCCLARQPGIGRVADTAL